MWNDARPYARPGPKRLELALPFSSLSVLTRVTPDLDTPQQQLAGPFCFVPYVDGAPFEFQILATDREQQIVEYGGPLMFVERGHNAGKANLDTVTQTYWNLPAGERRHQLRGQRVALPRDRSRRRALDTALATPPSSPTPRRPADARLGPGRAAFWPVLRSVPWSSRR